MNAALVANWNSVVKPEDLVYVLGDFTVNKKHIWIARELNGSKILVKGNHDTGSLAEYAEYFVDVCGCVVIGRTILTHIPVHPNQMERWRLNIHGHLHDHVVKVDREIETGIGMFTETVADSRYRCVSVEHTGFKPILLKDVNK